MHDGVKAKEVMSKGYEKPKLGKALRKAAIQYQLEGDDDTARYLFGLCDGLLKLL